MKTITGDDGQVYVLKTDMEQAIKERISKVSARAQQAEEQVRTLQTDLDAAKQSAGTSDVLAQQLEEYREQLTQANSRFDRYKAISKHGLVDDDMIEAIKCGLNTVGALSGLLTALSSQSVKLCLSFFASLLCDFS